MQDIKPRNKDYVIDLKQNKIKCPLCEGEVPY